jgi:8-oxo-dGTP pyrophosphatase MutT (NUDIX family)
MNQTEWENSVEWVGIVAGCLLKDGNKYLLVQEKQQKVYGLWNLPAGYVNKGESVEEAAVRETYEETGFRVKLGTQIGLFHEAAGTPVKHIFEAEVIGGALHTDPEEQLDVQWLAFDQIKKLKADDKLRSAWVWDLLEAYEHRN